MKATKVKTATVYNLELTEREFITLLSASAQVKPLDAVVFSERFNVKLECKDFHNLYNELSFIYKDE